MCAALPAVSRLVARVAAAHVARARRQLAARTHSWLAARAPARRSLIRSWSCRAVTEIKAMANKAMATTTRVSECTATKRLDDAAHDENGMVLHDDAAEFDAVDGVPHVEMACALPCQGHTRKRTLPAPPMPTAGRRAAAALHHRAHRLRTPPPWQPHPPASQSRAPDSCTATADPPWIRAPPSKTTPWTWAPWAAWRGAQQLHPHP